jgi:hypothetical protein
VRGVDKGTLSYLTNVKNAITVMPLKLSLHQFSATGKRVAIKRMTNIFDEPTDAKRAYREMHILR